MWHRHDVRAELESRLHTIEFAIRVETDTAWLVNLEQQRADVLSEAKARGLVLLDLADVEWLADRACY